MKFGAELVPLADRLSAMQRTRALVAVLVLVAVAVGDGSLDTSTPRLVPLSALFVALTAGIEAIRRLSGRRGLPLLSATLLVDGCYLAAVVVDTGGSASRLLFLVHLHVAATALLVSFRSGLVAASWHGALLVAAHELGVVEGEGTRAAVVAAASYLVVAGAVVAFASLNERELRSSRRSATTLVSLGSSLEGCRSLDDVTALGAAHLRAGLGHRRAAVLVRDHGDWVGACDGGRGAVQLRVLAPSDRGDEELERDGPRLVADVDDASPPCLSRVLPHGHNLAVLTLVADGVRLGLAVVECGAERPSLSMSELDLLERSVDRIALSVRALQLLADVERLAASDPLTGLPNRRMFELSLGREVARARRSGKPLALCMLDVDHFKAVNDTHGHPVGDQVLRELADALRRAVRDEDVVARYGGEEFAVLLPDAGADDAAVIAERLRAAAGEVGAVPVSASVGLASLVTVADGAELVAAADRALYQAKAKGRDRIVTFSPLQAASSG